MKATSHLFLSSVNKSHLDRALGREKRRTGRKKADGDMFRLLVLVS